jgi:hypothetical protein
VVATTEAEGEDRRPTTDDTEAEDGGEERMSWSGVVF